MQLHHLKIIYKRFHPQFGPPNLASKPAASLPPVYMQILIMPLFINDIFLLQRRRGTSLLACLSVSTAYHNESSFPFADNQHEDLVPIPFNKQRKPRYQSMGIKICTYPSVTYWGFL